ncbi:hypothetical protein GCM10010435_18830 [Winogradskya consettensis]|uniref:Transposase n=1 Tax=Winogradskya consettensis TaxID=113560 RepID=A0A919SWM1_9ACTN|nr:hypothetical protein [Actinoplanes consettensis]GIM78393.1 hypothetical protein Aco04nite_60220 [Actinoplanes consettensis]
MDQAAHAKDDIRERAVELRAQGWAVNYLSMRLGAAKSMAYAWGSERARQEQDHAAVMAAGRWEGKNAERDRLRAEVHGAASITVGDLSERGLQLVGALSTGGRAPSRSRGADSIG